MIMDSAIGLNEWPELLTNVGAKYRHGGYKKNTVRWIILPPSFVPVKGSFAKTGKIIYLKKSNPIGYSSFCDQNKKHFFAKLLSNKDFAFETKMS